MKPMLIVMRTQGLTNPTFNTFLDILTRKREDGVYWRVGPSPMDAAVDRARSQAATLFLKSDCDVAVFLDYDCEVPDVADMDYLAEKACEVKGVVGSVVSKKAIGEGWGGRFVDGKPHELYSDELVLLGPGAYVGGACTAYHRSVFENLIRGGMTFCPVQGFWPFFLPCVIQDPGSDSKEYLSEDWAICHYAREYADPPVPVYAAMKPVVVHHGRLGYTALHGNPDRAEVSVEA